MSASHVVHRLAADRPEAASTPPSTYLTLALLAFALLGLELLLPLFESLIPIGVESVEAAMLHWILTIVLWAGGSIALLTWSLHHTGFTLRGTLTSRAPMRTILVAGLVVFALASQWLLRGGVLPPIAEYAALSFRFGEAGMTAWLVQVVYYIAEVGVVALIIGFGQRAGEGWFRRRWVPWGACLGIDVGTGSLPHSRRGHRCLRYGAVPADGRGLRAGRQKPPDHVACPPGRLHRVTNRRPGANAASPETHSLCMRPQRSRAAPSSKRGPTMQPTAPEASWEARPLSRALSEAECWARLAQAPYGRIATRAADEMDIFPVNHGIDEGCIVFRTAAGTKLIELTIHTSIVFQIDGYDENEAFSVVVKGDADEVTSAERIAVLDTLEMHRWTPEEKDRWVAITPTKVSGRVFSLATQI